MCLVAQRATPSEGLTATSMFSLSTLYSMTKKRTSQNNENNEQITNFAEIRMYGYLVRPRIRIIVIQEVRP